MYECQCDEIHAAGACKMITAPSYKDALVLCGAVLFNEAGKNGDEERVFDRDDPLRGRQERLNPPFLRPHKDITYGSRPTTAPTGISETDRMRTPHRPEECEPVG